ncbi:hypothetical protein L6452_35222 [Arctium lappa]|uniref:Uncharacterized protein n=1 Tax=Arctium lappa TaxID=4217 RepID=A0ACB8Y6J1_ARCLA|nr:hypothetical protein L6452_35222 [Arctium lappa]
MKAWRHSPDGEVIFLFIPYALNAWQDTLHVSFIDWQRGFDFGRHAFGRIMNNVVDIVVVRIVAEIQRSSAIAEAFPQVSSRMSRVVFASLISASSH